MTHGFLEKFNVCTTKNSKHSRGSLHCWLRSRADKAAAVLSQTGSSCCCLFSLRLLTWARHLRYCPLRSGAKWHLEFLCTVYTGEPSHPLSHPLCTHRVSWRSAGASPSAHRAQAAKTPAPAHHSAHTHTFTLTELEFPIDLNLYVFGLWELTTVPGENLRVKPGPSCWRMTRPSHYSKLFIYLHY